MDDEPDVHETPSRSHQPVVKATVATREYHCAKHGAPHVDPYRSGCWISRQFETTAGGPWRLAGCRDYWSKYKLGWHVAPTANSHDAIAAVELALTEAARLTGRPLADLAERDEQGNVSRWSPS